MKIAITGASGFIGHRIGAYLRASGHDVRPVSLRSRPDPEPLAGCEAVINLAGETIAQRWTAAAKARILTSRVEGTRWLLEAMRGHPPNVLISASAIGYYGSRGDEILREDAPAGSDYLAQVCRAWEEAAIEAEALGARVVRLRIGMALGRDGGALRRMRLPFQLGVGGRFGSGEQWVSWIHLDDLCALTGFAIRESSLRGALNAVSPHPATNADFTRALAHALHRPAVIPMPAAGLRLMLGEMSEMLVGSQRVLPDAALRAGFEFDYPDLDAALVRIFS